MRERCKEGIDTALIAKITGLTADEVSQLLDSIVREQVLFLYINRIID